MKNYFLIADSHLGGREGDLTAMIRWVETLDPETDEIICLGDFFHIWTGAQVYHSPEVTEMMAAFSSFREQGGVVRMVVGNRDIFFKRGKNQPMSHLPFEEIALDFLEIRQGEKLFLFTHGDQVNSRDKKYLRWRRLVRSSLFRAFFALIPAGKVKRIMLDLEQKLKQTNKAFRLMFPEEEWERFIRQCRKKYDFDVLAVGHFHPENLIETPIDGRRALVVPDWLSHRKVIKLSSDGSYQLISTEP